MSSAPLLSQSGNPASAELDTYKVLLSTAADDASKLTADKAKADIMLTWQTAEGGFYKHLTDFKNTASKSKTELYVTAWTTGSKSSSWLGVNGESLGTIDNDATTSELFFLADVYKRSGDTKYRDAARKTLDFLLTMQYASGGFPQVYPARSADTPYSNYVTYNDDAMTRVMLVLEQVAKKVAPVDSADLFTSDQYAKLSSAIDKGVDYILKSQIVQGGVKTVWCAQHDPVNYAALGGRAYEWPSKSGKESVGVVGYLMSRPQTTEIKAAVQSALAWFRSSAVQAVDKAYVNRASGSTDITYNPIQTQAGSVMWYRFYDLDKDTPFFSGRTPNGSDCTTPAPFTTCTGKQYDIMAIEAERRYGYSWGGAYAATLLTYASSVGY
ncbi:pectate lyase [Viridibacterium curvum]|uniref:Pectate lyase n=1 Tax=Viridibacterium curvum TaxID=1101404 RepID=A0ABP9R6G8_9RHOO